MSLNSKLIMSKIISSVDTNSNEVVDYTEFLTACVNKSKILTDKNISEAFKMIDKNGDGKLSLDEIRSAFEVKTPDGTSSNSYYEEIISTLDLNGDGEIDYEEFKTAMNKLIDKNFSFIKRIDTKKMSSVLM